MGRNAWWTDEPNVLAVDGQKLGQPGDGSDMVELARIDLDATLGADNVQIEDDGEMLVTAGGQNYIVFLATVKKADGRADDKLVFVGVRTDVQLTPPDPD